ncbi:ERG4/ERG24 ergosterol biosynthesis protein [Pluteus cervinus]|uniref:ERG4/ERG24 ergosterol biosynthesis protein n=1 Tax=Pluteus cervinus TaxID=181527 RepID=A0ACD3AK67_9AGAR|nr:ERG4/ERG24 ergosterol biosynthesis protein [Pluteus cervinus]
MHITTHLPGNDLRLRSVVASSQVPSGLVISKEGQERDRRLDGHERLSYEFGGRRHHDWIPSLDVFNNLWNCLWFYDGRLEHPTSIDDIQPSLRRMWEDVRVKVYSGSSFFQLFLAQVITGFQQEGLPVPSLGYKTLVYNCNGNLTLYVTLVTSAILHTKGIFRSTGIIENYGHLMTVSMIYGFGVSFGVYFWAVATGNAMRMSGNTLYDVFMGACLNPRIGRIDLKMWAEVRVPWLIEFYTAVSGGCQQYEKYGYVTPDMAFMILATGLYLNACAKGEECIPQTWDMYHEKWGFMSFSGISLASHSLTFIASCIWHPTIRVQWSTPAYVLIYTAFLSAYYIWDTSMAQKSHFKMQTQGITKFRKTFPQLPWNTIQNPTFIQTAHGNRLLMGGWWAYSRKPTGLWGAIIGRCSIIPYFYSVFFIVVLIHRCSRDFERCSKKYEKDWDRHREVVPYRFIPCVY